MKLNFQTRDWDELKNIVLGLSQEALSLNQVGIGDTVRLVRFEIDQKKSGKCFDGLISLEMATSESWFFDKYSFIDIDVNNGEGKFLYQDENIIMFVLKPY